MQRVHAKLVFKSKNPAWCQFLHLPTPNLPYWWHARSAHTLRTPCHYCDNAQESTPIGKQPAVPPVLVKSG